MSHQLTGNILHIHPLQHFSSGFTKREFVIKESEGKYPQEVKFDAVKDDCLKLDSYRVGDEITVSFNIRGNEHNGKHYVSLQAWRFEKGQGARQDSRPSTQNGAAPPSQSADFDDDEIPF